MEIVYQLSDIESVAEKILAIDLKKIILFEGEMGAGKTTLIKTIAKKMGVEGAISSPTFSIVNEYEGDEIIYHFDCYRLKSESEALDFGIEEYLYSGHWCFIEWSSKIENLIPAEHSIIRIAIENEEIRRIIVD